MAFHNSNNNNKNQFYNNHTLNNNNKERNLISLKQILEKKESNDKITYPDFLNAIVKESKFDRNYDNAERLFEMFIERLNYSISRQSQPRYADDEISVFQRSIATMIRYAPNSQKALNYTEYLLHQRFPLRNEHVEITCLINLIYVYKEEGSNDAMNKALELIRIGLSREIYNLKPYRRDDRDSVAEVFEQVSKKVLSFHSLQFSRDKKSLEPLKTNRPQRFSTF